MFEEKPPLDGVYLVHFGVRGMRWGVSHDPGGKSLSKRSAKKLAVLATAAAGAAAVSLILGSKGRTMVGEAAMNNFVLNRQRKAQAKINPFTDAAKRYREAQIAWLSVEERRVAKDRGEVNGGN
jgi:hypothetical protein